MELTLVVRGVFFHPDAGLGACKGWKADVGASSVAFMSSPSFVKLTVLRDIGWDRWDPIRLNGSEGGWRRSHAAEEYDRYLRRVAGGLESGEPYDALVDYLVRIETEHMGLTSTPTARTRAEATVAAIREHVESIK